jgi:putative redox protein
MDFTTLLNGHPVITDTDDGNPQPTKGPRPKALMLVALTGCTGIDVVSILQKMRVSFSNLRIDVEAALTEGDAAVYHTVKLLYYINVAPEDRPKVEKAVALSMDKYCGVSAMFRQFATLEREIVFL